jgi:hypothetical protein
MSSLNNSQYVVLPLHVSSSREGGMSMVYPYAGTNLHTVCASLRLDKQKAELATQLAEMATSVLLTLQKLQAQKPQVGLLRRMAPAGGVAAQFATWTVQHCKQNHCL